MSKICPRTELHEGWYYTSGAYRCQRCDGEIIDEEYTKKLLVAVSECNEQQTNTTICLECHKPTLYKDFNGAISCHTCESFEAYWNSRVWAKEPESNFKVLIQMTSKEVWILNPDNFDDWWNENYLSLGEHIRMVAHTTWKTRRNLYNV